MSHLLLLFMCDFTLIKGRIKSSCYGLLADSTLKIECLAPGQNCITCRKGKSLKKKERKHQSYAHELHGN